MVRGKGMGALIEKPKGIEGGRRGDENLIVFLFTSIGSVLYDGPSLLITVVSQASEPSWELE